MPERMNVRKWVPYRYHDVTPEDIEASKSGIAEPPNPNAAIERQFMLAAWEYVDDRVNAGQASRESDRLRATLHAAYDSLRAAGGPRP